MGTALKELFSAQLLQVLGFTYTSYLQAIRFEIVQGNLKNYIHLEAFVNFVWIVLLV